MDFNLDVFDRTEKIKSVDKKDDLENKAYVSFSGGKDSSVLSDLVDIALPGNRIPRVFINTGIEYSDIVKFVKEKQKEDDRIVIVNSGVNIKSMLNEYGYPFKSKQHSHNVAIYQNNREEVDKIVQEIEDNKELLKSYDYISNLPKGTKTIIKYIYGLRERERDIYLYSDCP